MIGFARRRPNFDNARRAAGSRQVGEPLRTRAIGKGCSNHPEYPRKAEQYLYGGLRKAGIPEK